MVNGGLTPIDFVPSRLNALRVANDRLGRECVRAHTDKGLRGEFKMALPIVKASFDERCER